MGDIDKITKARSQLLLHYPMYGSLATYLKPKEVPEEEMPPYAKIGTNGEELVYQEGCLDDMSLKELQATIAHEVLHLGLGHLWRQGERRQTKWNVATDYAINNMLDREGLRPGKCLVNHEYDGMSAEEIYNELEDENNQAKCPECGSEDIEKERLDIGPNGQARAKYSCNDCGHEWEENGIVTEGGDSSGKEAVDWNEVNDYRQDTHENWDEAKKGSGSGSGEEEDNENQSGSSSGGTNDEEGNEEKGPSGTKIQEEAKREEMRQEWKRRMIEAAENARMQGNLPAGMDAVIEELTEPKLDWKSLLRRVISKNSRNDYTYYRPNKRYGIIYPTLRNPEINVAIGVDTSGSIRDSELSMFLSEIKSIANTFDEFKLLLMAGDTEVHTEVEAHDMKSIEGFRENLQGRGGTDYRPFFERADDESDINALIVLGDSFGEMPDHDSFNFDTVWVFTERDHKEIPFGTECILEE